ncbi:RidA family protein [Lentisphaera profundi]|uniref:RidA family protein n=1 Tax=Lentisphaera profundi TaxID=1658616 RepID=A0ABY7VUZ8_9BACT|nr:RidA family protein [Lentisphaera profundi]WDE98040.1 RidA family protein [Lentisphaera profundi]
MKKKIQTDQAPGAIGPYSQAIDLGDLIFVSGQIPLDPKLGSIVSGGIETQTEQVMKNIGAILDAANLTYSDVVRAEVFLTNMDNFGKVNEIYVQYFSEEPKPARFAVGVASLPMNSLIEIAVIAKRS